MEIIDLWGVAKFDPRGMIGTIYNGDYQTLLHTKYRSSGPCGFREEDFLSFFPIVSLWRLSTPGGVAKFGPKELCRGPLAIAIYQISKLWAMCQRKKNDFFFIKTCMLPWQPEFQSDPPPNNMQPFLQPSDAVYIVYFDQYPSSGFRDVEF